LQRELQRAIVAGILTSASAAADVVPELDLSRLLRLHVVALRRALSTPKTLAEVVAFVSDLLYDHTAPPPLEARGGNEGVEPGRGQRTAKRGPRPLSFTTDVCTALHFLRADRKGRTGTGDNLMVHVHHINPRLLPICKHHHPSAPLQRKGMTCCPG
jgi:hypothetical protein